ncbi:MAG: site-specific integrase [Gammaproteobacteria bacterium]|nr:MAG: site-specific integrase [Gammaproteobacteria bacterium]
MAYRRKDSAVYWVSFADASGTRVRRSTETTARKEAEALEAKWKLEAHQQKQWGAPPSFTFDELMLKYLQATETEKRSAERDRMSAKHLYPAFTGRNLREISAANVRKYIDDRKAKGAKPATINKEVGLLSAAINYARMEWDWEIPNPAAGRRLREPEGRLRWLTRAEAGALIRAAEAQRRAPHLPDFIRLALNTGCRRGELLGLEWRRVDLQRGLLYLEGDHTKSGRRRYVPLNQAARGALLSRMRFRAKYCPASPWVFAARSGKRIQSVKTAFASACEAAGIEDFRIHDLRHTCAAWLVSAGVPLPEVRDLLGHSTVTMTERYAHLAPENVRAAVQRLDGLHESGHGEVIHNSESRFGHGDDSAEKRKEVAAM